MIAHRLQTIMTAENLLYLENPRSVLSAEKGTPEYIEIMDRLKRTSYAHQADDGEDDKEEISYESAEEDEKKDGNLSFRSNCSYQSAHSMAMDKEGRRESRSIAKDIKRVS